MKTFLTVLLLGVGMLTRAQPSTNSTVNTLINEDGKTMSIQVEGQRNGQTITYNRTFGVAKLTASEKEMLKNRILDSLGVGQSSGVSVPAKRASPNATGPITSANSTNNTQAIVTFRCETCAGKVKLLIASPTDDFSIERDAKANTDKRLFPYQLSLSPGDYKLTYYQNGVLQIQSSFTVKTEQENTIVIK